MTIANQIKNIDAVIIRAKAGDALAISTLKILLPALYEDDISAYLNAVDALIEQGHAI